MMSYTEEDLKEKTEEAGENQVNKKKKVEDLPYCTTAPSAEHMRSHDEDEPCDDGRAGNAEEA
jgi:hypothetical protein